MVLILSGTINPVDGMDYLEITDDRVRLGQYIDSARFFICNTNIDKIIFCDNSNSLFPELIKLKEDAKEYGKTFEILSFQGSNDMIVEYGKGYGEGQIMEYVLMNSKVLMGEDYIVKLTGRMILDNINVLSRRLNTDKAYINACVIAGERVTDTRIYAMPIVIFQKYFINAYTQVNDKKGYFLEHVYADIIKSNQLQFLNFPRYPRIVGVAGTSGHIYAYKKWKCLIKDIISRFQFYALNR